LAEPTTTRATIRQNIIRKLYSTHHPIVGTTTATGATDDSLSVTAVTDNILAPSGQTEDFNHSFIYVATKGATGPSVGDVVRVVNTNFFGSNSFLDISPNFSSPFLTGQTYEIHYKFHPSVINNKINEILENIRGFVLVPLSGLIVNGNFNTNVSSWTASGTTPTWVEAAAGATQAAGTLFGVGALNLTSGAVTTYTYQRVNIAGGTPLMLSCFAKIVAGTSVEMEIWDVTNAAQIGESANTTVQNEWIHLQLGVSVPITCTEVEVRLYAGGSTSVFYDAIQLIRRDQQIFDLPSDFDYPEDFESVLYFPKGDQIEVGTSSNAFRSLQHRIEKWGDADILSTPLGGSVSQRIQLVAGSVGTRRWSSFGTAGTTPDWGYRIGSNIDHPLFIRGRVDYATVTSDSTTIYAPEDYITGLVYADLIEDLAQEDLDQGNNDGYATKMTKADNIRQKLDPLARNKSDDKGIVHGTFNRHGS